ncbi:MAG: hypothetical protein ABH983_00015 [Candidatus Micrarchaeota archaeon]
MKHMLIILTLIIGLMVFGCTSTPNAQDTPSVPPAGDDEGSGVPAASGEPSDQPTVPEETTPEEPAEPSGDNFAGLDYDGVLALGLPAECDVTMATGQETMSYKMYIDGQNVRWESSDMDMEDCSKVVYVATDNAVAIGCEGGNYPPGSSCNWLVMSDEGESEPTETEMGDYSSPEFGGVPAAQISCKPWIPDSSKFSTPGKACTMDDYMDEMMAGYQ